MELGQSVLIMAAGVLIISIAYAAGRSGSTSALWVAVYWVGEVVLFAPAVLRVVSRSGPGKVEGAALVVGLAAATYLVKYIYSPLQFRFPDELQHWRSTTDLLATGHLFGVNHLLPISPGYPALEVVTGALVSTTGLSIFVAGLIVAAAAHLLLATALYLIFAQVSGSPRVAVAACTIYATNPHYQVFDAIFGYQTLALAFLGLTLVTVLQISAEPGRTQGIQWRVLAIILVLTTVVTHHVTSYVLTATLLLLVLTAVASRRRRRMATIARSAEGRILLLATLSMCAIMVWVLAVAPLTTTYLQPAIRNFMSGISGVITVQPSSHSAAPGGPLADQFANYASAALVTIGLPFGWRHIWRTQRQNIWALALASGSACYYVIALLRLTMPDGAELAGRSLTYLYIPIGYTLAMALAWLGQATLPSIGRLRQAHTSVVVTIAIAILLFGGLAAGWPAYWERLPGRYVVDGFESGITPEGVATATWARRVLGSSNRMSADFTNYVLLGSYGDQDVVSGVNDLYNSSEYTPAMSTLAQQNAVRYVVVDLRTSRYKAVAGGYFPAPSSNDISPIPLSNLTKFDSIPGVDRIYDSGNIIIYELPVDHHAP
ncbi:MAG: hypothetical protein ACRDRN_11270 [Sciscionella sp.]